MISGDLDKKVAKRKAYLNEHIVIGYLFLFFCIIVAVFFKENSSLYGYASFIVSIFAMITGNFVRETRYYDYIVNRVKKTLSKKDNKDNITKELKVTNVKLMFNKDIDYWVYLIEAENNKGKSEDFFVGREGKKIADFIKSNLLKEKVKYEIRDDVIISILVD